MNKQTLVPLLTAACLLLPLPAGAAGTPAVPPTQQLQTQLPFLNLPNARPERLDRYSVWAAAHPELDMADVVFQVNLDLDRVPYDNPRTVSDPDSLTVLVNKHNALPAGYVPELEALGSGYGSGSLRPEAARAFRAMADAARAEGISLRSVSAYRSYSYQDSLYHRYLARYPQKAVDTFSARAGHSEHQTGLALDINTASTSAHFENTPAYAWLQAHCAEYGFILRYGQGKESITGYRFEPWHYRYVGADLARACTQQELCYEEFLALGLTAEPSPDAVPEPDPAARPVFPLAAGHPVAL